MNKDKMVRICPECGNELIYCDRYKSWICSEKECNYEKSTCIMENNGWCDSDYGNKQSCDGINIPKDCPYNKDLKSAMKMVSRPPRREIKENENM